MRTVSFSAAGDALALRVMRFAQENGLTGPGLHHLEIAHDDWCSFLNGRAECDCNPDISVMGDTRE